MRSTEV